MLDARSAWKKGHTSDEEDLFHIIDLGGETSNIFDFQPYLGFMIQFDVHIFQVDWERLCHRSDLATLQASRCRIFWNV